MTHRNNLGAAFAALLLSTAAHAFEPTNPTGEDGLSGVEWVRQTLEAGFDGAEVRPGNWSGSASAPEYLHRAVTLDSLEGTNANASASLADSVTDSGLTHHSAASLAQGASMEEVVVSATRRRHPQWHPPVVEEPENDWRARDHALRTDIGRIEVGRAVIYQDLSDRRRYEPNRDEYVDPRPQQLVSVGVGRLRAQD